MDRFCYRGGLIDMPWWPELRDAVESDWGAVDQAEVVS